MAPAKKQTVTEVLRRALTMRAEKLLDEKFRPLLPQQAEEAREHGFNYIEELSTRWRGRYFYFVAKYRVSRKDAKQPSFEVLTTRMEYSGSQRFHLAYMRHTGHWCEVYQGLTLDECFQAITEEEVFRPVP